MVSCTPQPHYYMFLVPLSLIIICTCTLKELQSSFCVYVGESGEGPLICPLDDYETVCCNISSLLLCPNYSSRHVAPVCLYCSSDGSTDFLQCSGHFGTGIEPICTYVYKSYPMFASGSITVMVMVVVWFFPRMMDSSVSLP